MNQANRRILGIVPIRSGSAGLPDKNIKIFDGQPLFVHALRLVQECACCDRVIVSTDSAEYADLVRVKQGEAPFIRPAPLATSSVRLHYVLRHALKWFDELGEHYDAVLSVQATAPLLSQNTLRKMIDLFHNTGCLAVGTGTQITHGHPYLARSLDSETRGTTEFLELPKGAQRYPRQVRPDLYYFNGAAFLRDRSLLDEVDDSSNCLGKNPLMVTVDVYEGINIDSDLDFELAQYALDRKKSS